MSDDTKGRLIAVLWTVFCGVAAIFMFDYLLPRIKEMGPYSMMAVGVPIIFGLVCLYFFGVVKLDDRYRIMDD